MESTGDAADAVQPTATEEETKDDNNVKGEGSSTSLVVVDWKLLEVEVDESEGNEGSNKSKEGAVGIIAAAEVDTEKTLDVEVDDGDKIISKEVGSLKRKSCGGEDTADKGDDTDIDEAKRVKAADDEVGDKEEKIVVAVDTATEPTGSEKNTDTSDIKPDDSVAAPKDKIHIGFGAFNKDDIVVIDVDDESNDGDEIESVMTLTQQPLGCKSNDHNDGSKINLEGQEIMGNIQSEGVENEELKKTDKPVEDDEEGGTSGSAAQSAEGKESKVEEVMIMIEDSSNASSAQQQAPHPPPPSQGGSVGWDHEKLLLISEIESLRGKVSRLTERQMLLEDFALVEHSARFRTFFHARDLLLEMGRKRQLTDPACALAPGSSYLIAILRVINEKADGEIEELHVTEKDVLAIEETLKKLKNRLSESSFNSRSPGKSVQSVDLNTSVSSDTSFPPTLPHKFTADNQPIYDSGVPKGVLPNPLYSGKGQSGAGNSSGSPKKRVRQRPKITCEVCQLSMNAPFYRNKHIYQHVGIIYACPICKEKKGNSQRDVNKCLREKHGTVPNEGTAIALRYIQDEDGSFRLITSKEQLEKEQKLYLDKFNALSAEEKEKVKLKFLSDQERSSTEEQNKSETKYEENSGTNWDLPADTSTQLTQPTGENEDIEILEVVPGTPGASENSKTDNTSATTPSDRVKEMTQKDLAKKLDHQGIAVKDMFLSSNTSNSNGPKLGKPFPVPTIAISSSSTSNSAGSPTRSLPTMANKPGLTPTSSKRKNRGRKRAGLSPLGTLATEGGSAQSFVKKQQPGRYFQSTKSGSGLSMASRSILGRGLPQQNPPPKTKSNFIIANKPYDKFDSTFGPTRPTVSSFGGRVSPYPNTSGAGLGRGRGVVNQLDPGISTYTGTGRGLTPSSSNGAASARRLIPMPSASSMMESSLFESRYSNSGGRSRNIPSSEERFKLDASCLGDKPRSNSSNGGLKRFDYSSGLGGRTNDDSLTDDCPSPSLLSGRPTFYDIGDFGFGGTEYRKNNNTSRSGSIVIGRDRSERSNFFASSPPAERHLLNNEFRSNAWNSSLSSTNNNNAGTLGGTFFRTEEAMERDPILRNPRFSESTSNNYTMSSRPSQYGYFTSGSAAGQGLGGDASGSSSKFSQGQFNSYADYAKSVLSQNRFF